MFNPSRDQVRQFFFRAWANYRSGKPLPGLETQAVQVILLHPEYHPMLDDPDGSANLEFPPENGAMNPFLHLSLHLAIEEQLSIDQPAGIKAEFDRLTGGSADRHAALHDALECLGETVWEAQQRGAQPDAAAYLDRLRRK